MFYYLNGVLALCGSNSAVIDCNGVGYKLTVSSKTIGKIAGKEGESVKLFTYLAVREDAVELFGFSDENELDTYKLLTGVSGIGPKAAISILSEMTPEKLAYAIASGDTKAISKAQGLGSKTAARVVLELKDKLTKQSIELSGGDFAGDIPESGQNNLATARDALVGFGYTQADALSLLKGIDGTLDCEEILRQAFKKLSKF